MAKSFKRAGAADKSMSNSGPSNKGKEIPLKSPSSHRKTTGEDKQGCQEQDCQDGQKVAKGKCAKNTSLRFKIQIVFVKTGHVMTRSKKNKIEYSDYESVSDSAEESYTNEQAKRLLGKIVDFGTKLPK